MRILYHHRTSARDGSAVHIDGLVSALRRAGAEVLVVAPSSAASTVAEGSSWLHALRSRLPRFIHELGELVYNGPEAIALARAIGRFNPDLVYERSNLYLVSGAWTAARRGLPLIEEVNAPYFMERSRHGGLRLPALARWSERRAWRGADAIVAVTQVLAEIVAEEGVPPDRLHVMPNGIDDKLFGPRTIDPTAKERLGLSGMTILGFTGFVRDWNGLGTVLELLAAPDGKGCFLLVVGDGPARPALEQRAQALGVGQRLRFTGRLERKDVARYVSAFDVALQPAANPYASPLKLFEYMALGRAIVAPDQPNIREILEDGVNAALFVPGNERSFADAVVRMTRDDELRTRCARRAMVTVQRRRLTWDRNAERVLALGESLRRCRRSR